MGEARISGGELVLDYSVEVNEGQGVFLVLPVDDVGEGMGWPVSTFLSEDKQVGRIEAGSFIEETGVWEPYGHAIRYLEPGTHRLVLRLRWPPDLFLPHSPAVGDCGVLPQFARSEKHPQPRPLNRCAKSLRLSVAVIACGGPDGDFFRVAARREWVLEPGVRVVCGGVVGAAENFQNILVGEIPISGNLSGVEGCAR